MAVGKFRHGSNVAVATVSLLVILVVINIFSYHHFVRWDLTRNHDYTISPVTKEILGDLENIVNVKVYLSKNLPAALLTFERQLRDLLAEYEVYGKGKLRISYISPPSDRETERELFLQGIRRQPVAVFTGDTSTQARVYNSIVVEYEDHREVIPSLLDEVSRGRAGLISDFEYLLTSKIFKVQRTKRQVVGWLTNSPDIDLDKDYRTLREIVRKEWDMRDVRLDPATRIPPDIAVLVVVGPTDFTDAQLFEIDQYLMRGGKIFALVETYKRQFRNKSLEALVEKPANFTNLLEHYGVKVNNEIVLDRYCALAPLTRYSIAPYQFWVKILPGNMDRTHPAVARLRSLVLPWTQTLDPATSMPEEVKFIPLAKSSSFSVVRWGSRIIPDPSPSAGGGNQSRQGKKRTVIAALTGVFPSYFPEGTPYPLDEGTTQPRRGRTPESERRYVSPETQIVVVGNAWFLDDDFLRMSSFPLERNHNVPFFLNTLEWLALGKGLGQIRAREPVGRPIRADLTDAQRNAYKIFGTFTMPILVIIGGIAYNVVRRKRRRRIAARLLGGSA